MIGAILNAFVLLPIYAWAFHINVADLVSLGSAVNASVDNLFTFIALITIPFNLLKGIMLSVIVLLIYKRVSHLMKAKDSEVS